MLSQHHSDRGTAIVVLGMHRSGTSALTGILSRCGVPLGSRLYDGHAGINDKGYFENAPLADLNDDLLLAVGSCWHDLSGPSARMVAAAATQAVSPGHGRGS